MKNKIKQFAQRLLGQRDELIPPKKLWFVGSGAFKKIGEEFFRYFVEIGELKPHEKVLDVGCGVGRLAIPLTKYLGQDGSYDGFDIVAEGIDWCQKEITSKYPNFHFQLADIFNKFYNPNGKHKSFEYKFPYKDGSFDFIFLASVFTHMLPKDMENYFSEIARVLKKGGRCLITFFLLNKESLPLIDKGKSSQKFKYDFGQYRIIDANMPEAAVSYDEAFILKLYEKYGIKTKYPIHYGSWCGRSNFLSYQDIVLAFKK